MADDLFRAIALPAAFDGCGAGTEEVAVVETASGYAELVDAVAFVALPEPVQAVCRWGQEFSAGFEFGSAGVRWVGVVAVGSGW